MAGLLVRGCGGFQSAVNKDADRNQHHPGAADSDLPLKEMMPIGIGITRNRHHPVL
jgi:hypothetical protein